VFLSTDSGDTWNEIALPTSNSANPDLVSALVIFNSSTLYVGTVRGALYRLRKGSGGWSNAGVAQLNSPRSGFISDIVVLGTAQRIIWLSYSSFGGGHVYRSLNSGSNWSNRTGNLPDIPVNAIVIDPQNEQRLYAATDHGVYKSTNSGTQWQDFSNGLPNVVVGDLILHERLRLLRAGTRNRGTWQVAI
jgi:photosystem II stability/assembly factor-like uncharacterized protein